MEIDRQVLRSIIWKIFQDINLSEKSDTKSSLKDQAFRESIMNPNFCLSSGKLNEAVGSWTIKCHDLIIDRKSSFPDLQNCLQLIYSNSK